VDFWAQHKDFVLRILAGFAVFLVALIARGVAYGDDLEDAESQNRSLKSKIKQLKLRAPKDTNRLNTDADKLNANAETIAKQFAWDRSRSDLDLTLIKRTFAHLRRFKDNPEGLALAAPAARASISADLNGGFGQLRLNVRDELEEEANERGCRLGNGLGFGDIVRIEENQLIQYLVQLELAARIVRYSIDSGVSHVDEIRVDSERDDAVPGVHKEVLEQYDMTFYIRSEQESIGKILSRLQYSKPPGGALSLLVVDRVDKSEDQVKVEFGILCCAVRTDVPFVVKDESKGGGQ